MLLLLSVVLPLAVALGAPPPTAWWPAQGAPGCYRFADATAADRAEAILRRHAPGLSGRRLRAAMALYRAERVAHLDERRPRGAAACAAALYRTLDRRRGPAGAFVIPRLLDTLGQHARAVPLYEELAARFPRQAEAGEALLRAAALRDGLPLGDRLPPLPPVSAPPARPGAADAPCDVAGAWPPDPRRTRGLEVRGGLREATVVQQVRRHIAGVDRCPEARRATYPGQPTAPARGRISLLILPTGGVGSVTVEGDRSLRRLFDACWAPDVHRWRFPVAANACPTAVTDFGVGLAGDAPGP